MSRTSNIFVRVEPNVKEQAEEILGRLGIPMSNAIGIFLRQVILQRGIPFEIKIHSPKPLSIGELNESEINLELQKGIDDIKNNRIFTADEMEKELAERFSL